MFGGVSGNGGVSMSGTAMGESGVLDVLSESSELSEEFSLRGSCLARTSRVVVLAVVAGCEWGNSVVE